MNQSGTTLGIIFAAVIMSFVFGYWLQLSPPHGIWLYAPPTDGSGKPSDALFIGAALGCLVFATLYLVGSIGIFFWTKLRDLLLPQVFLPLVASALIIFALMAVLFELAGS